ncbi:integrase catalytic domain-containing protein [Trichonephila clavipes]|nr:integrase catalytic domain-containing protein [Trichonephila clavipes]
MMGHNGVPAHFCAPVCDRLHMAYSGSMAATIAKSHTVGFFSLLRGNLKNLVDRDEGTSQTDSFTRLHVACTLVNALLQLVKWSRIRGWRCRVLGSSPDATERLDPLTNTCGEVSIRTISTILPAKRVVGYLKEDLIRVVENLDGTVESTDTIVKLKTKIENSSTFESDPDFVKTLIQNCIDERVSQNEREVTLEKQKIELAKLQLAKLEKEIELQTAKNKALSLNPAAKVEDKQFETNIEKMITSIKTLSLPVPTRSENFNLFFQSLERAFLTKKINDEYKSEILINLLGERAHNVLLYIKEEELNDYEKLKSIVLREFQLTPRECLNSFKNAVKSSGETYIQFAARLTANFQYYCSLRKVNSFESLCDLIISDKLFETLNKETATHIGIREAEDWFRPIDLAKECDIYISSRSGSHKEIPITYGYTQDPFKNRSQNFKPKIKENYPQYLERENKNCFICGDSSHCARDCEKRFEPKESTATSIIK